MDGATVVGLIAAIQQILITTYKCGKDMVLFKEDVRALAIELTLLKANLEHIQLVLETERLQLDLENLEDTSILRTSNFTSPEFQRMLMTTQAMLQELHRRLQPKTNVIRKTWQRITWVLEKSEVEAYVRRLERAKSWFMLAATSDNTVLLRDMFRKISGLEQTLTLETERFEERHSTEIRSLQQDKIQKWLAPHLNDSIYQQSLELLQPGTGDWFYDMVKTVWTIPIASSGTRLWVQARPGFGKTTLMAGAIARSIKAAQSQQQQPSIAYHFCSFAEHTSQDLRDILGNIIFQLCCSQISLFAKTVQLHPKQGDTSNILGVDRLTPAQLENLLIALLGQTGTCCIFIDALNESKEPALVLRALKNILNQCANVHILVTSTDSLSQDISDNDIHILILSEIDNAADIEVYIDSWLTDHRKLSLLPQTVKTEIKLELQKSAVGVFRWVQCQLYALASQKSIKEIRKSLRQLPSSLEETYHRVLKNVQPDDRQLARNILLWLCFSVRPMTFEEVCEAAILDDEEVDETTRLLDPQDILEACPGLVRYDRRNNTLLLAHSSVLAFLTSENLGQSTQQEFYMDSRLMQTMLGKHCLLYLLAQDLASGFVANKEELIDRLHAWPLLSYIGDTLWDHLYGIDPKGVLQPLLIRFLDSQRLPRGGNFGSWVQVFSPDIPTGRIEVTTPLYFAAREGHLPLVQMILAIEGKKSLEQPGGMYASTPLHVASWAGHAEVVRALIVAGADAVHERNSVGESGLYWATVCGQDEVVQILKDAGAVLDAAQDEHRGLLAVLEGKKKKEFEFGFKEQKRERLVELKAATKIGYNPSIVGNRASEIEAMPTSDL